MSLKKLVTLIGIFEDSDLLEFEILIKNRKNQKAVKILQTIYLRKIEVPEKRPKWDINQLSKKIGISKSYLKLNIQTLIKEIENYLIYKSISEFEPNRDFLLKKILLKNQLDDVFIQEFERQKKKELINKDFSDNLIHEYLSGKDYLDFLSKKDTKKVTFEKNIENILRLDRYYLIQRIKGVMELVLLNIQFPDKNFEETPFFKEMNRLIELEYFSEDILFQIYKLGLKLLLDETEDYEKLSHLLKNNLNQLSKKDLFFIYTILIHYHITRKSTNTSNLKRVFLLYKEMIQFGFLLENDAIPPGKFKNIVTLACIFKEYSWAEQFIENYSKSIDSKSRASVVNFNYGAIHFYQGNWEQAQDFLFKVDSVNIFYALDSKSLLSRIYFEKKEYFALIRFMESFKDFIRKNKTIGKQRKTGYLNYLKILKQLVKVSQNSLGYKYQSSLHEKLESITPITYKDWLKEKIQAL